MEYSQDQIPPEMYSQQMQQYPQQIPQPDIPISKDRDFMQWLFNFKEEVVGPLIHIWRGKEEVNPGDWQFPKDRDGKEIKSPIMNDKGITWCCGRISSFINAVYIVSNYDENAMNWTMRKVGRNVWNGLSKQYQEFELEKINIPVVAFEVISKVHAVLLGARGDGFRRFFMSTHHVDEVKHTQNVEQQKQGRIMGLFGRKQQPIIPPGY